MDSQKLLFSWRAPKLPYLWLPFHPDLIWYLKFSCFLVLVHILRLSLGQTYLVYMLHLFGGGGNFYPLSWGVTPFRTPFSRYGYPPILMGPISFESHRSLLLKEKSSKVGFLLLNYWNSYQSCTFFWFSCTLCTWNHVHNVQRHGHKFMDTSLWAIF